MDFASDVAAITGSFITAASGQITGTVTGYQIDFSPYLRIFPSILDVAGASADATAALAAYNAGNIAGFLGILLAGNDSVFGSPYGGNYAIGWAGNDVFTPEGGADTFDGGTGHNIVQLAGPESEYAIVYTGNTGATITDDIPSRDGVVTSINNEVLQFADQPYFIESGDNANIARLYSAGLGRLPDPNGLFGWEDVYSTNVSAAAKAQGVYVSLAQTSGGFNGSLSIADGIILSPEFTAKYGSLSNAGFVTQLYQNVLGRAPDTTGLNGWLTLMSPGNASGTVFTRGMVLVGFAESPENAAKSATWMTDMAHSG